MLSLAASEVRIRSETRANNDFPHPTCDRGPGLLGNLRNFSAINSAKLSAEARSLYEMRKITGDCAVEGFKCED